MVTKCDCIKTLKHKYYIKLYICTKLERDYFKGVIILSMTISMEDWDERILNLGRSVSKREYREGMVNKKAEI